jgi:hypothetical protein
MHVKAVARAVTFTAALALAKEMPKDELRAAGKDPRKPNLRVALTGQQSFSTQVFDTRIS